jgi:predicted deacetylase
MITEEQLEILLYKMDAEGFDYCFHGYSNWKEIKDKEFHKLREAYVKAKTDLENYIQNLAEE